MKLTSRVCWELTQATHKGRALTTLLEPGMWLHGICGSTGWDVLKVSSQRHPSCFPWGQVLVSCVSVFCCCMKHTHIHIETDRQIPKHYNLNNRQFLLSVGSSALCNVGCLNHAIYTPYVIQLEPHLLPTPFPIIWCLQICLFPVLSLQQDNLDFMVAW